MPGELTMLNELRRIMREELLDLLADPTTPWQTLDVLYEEPRVERVWKQHGDNRLYLHRIHPCKKPFFHAHPWPSAVHVFGKYRMHIGYGPLTDGPPPFAATLELHWGAGYEMLDPNGWHDVAPYDEPSLSLMLTGPVWGDRALPPAQKSANKPLEDSARDALIHDISFALGAWILRV